jgi:hypothetical protein
MDQVGDLNVVGGLKQAKRKKAGGVTRGVE